MTPRREKGEIEAELQRVERERDEAQAHLRAATDLVIRANKMIPGFASAWMPATLSDTEEARQRAARLLGMARSVYESRSVAV